MILFDYLRRDGRRGHADQPGDREGDNLKLVTNVLGAALCVLLSGWLLATPTVAFEPEDPVVPEEEEPPPLEEEEPVEEPEPPPEPPSALDADDVPETEYLENFIRDKDMAIALGKAFFWDMQVGSDGMTACASCHFHAGADVRTKNTLMRKVDDYRGPNMELSPHDFPFHKKIDPDLKSSSDDDNVESDNSEVVGSQGVVTKDYLSIVPLLPAELGLIKPNADHSVGSAGTRQVTGRNAPTVINAAFLDRAFFDGRANRFFNGVNPFGITDSSAIVYRASRKKIIKTKKMLLDNSALASQAVGPPDSDIEMRWKGRPFAALGRKMLTLRPLAHQTVHPDDSVLGDYASEHGKGLKLPYTYSYMIRKAFRNRWWKGLGLVEGGYTHMEANFSLFWGLAIQCYEKTLISDDSKYDRVQRGEETFTPQEEQGLSLFLNEGKCISCHKGSEFAGATVSSTRGNGGQTGEQIELMLMANGVEEKVYDSGFYNIGVRPTSDDLGAGADGPFGPFSLTRRVQQGQSVSLSQQSTKTVPPGDDKVAVDGSFKVPTLRNIELTGPYMHTGGMSTLEQVIRFYIRGGDFQNTLNRAPDVGGIEEIAGDQDAIDALVAFLKTLTDERVRTKAAPFDHPELVVPDGHKEFLLTEALDDFVVIPAVGAAGGPPIKSFEEILNEAP